MDIKIIGVIGAAAVLCYRLYTAYQNYTQQRKERIAGTNTNRSRSMKGTVGTPQKYSLELPVHMEKVYDLNDTASLQLQNEEKELYAIVIDESAEEFKTAQRKYGAYQDGLSLLENYKQIQLASFRHDMKVISEEELSIGIANANNRGVQFDAQIADIPFPISYYTVFIEKNDALYFLVAWTPIGMKKENAPHLLELLRSFRPY